MGKEKEEANEIVSIKRQKISVWRDDLNECIDYMMGEVARTSQGDVARSAWTRSAKTLALCVLGIILSQSAVLQRMAEAIALGGISEAKMPSIERRFARFVANERVQVSKIWKPFLTQVLAYWKGKAVQLVLDCTPFDDRAIIVYLGLVVHSRVLPVAWRIMPAQEKWDQGQWDPGRASCWMKSACIWSRPTVRWWQIEAWRAHHW